MEKLVLLDANHLMHRAYWAIQRNLSTSKGEQTNAVFGVASMLLTLLKRESPGAMIACWDEGSETFRHEKYGGYKAGRQKTPDEFYDQIARVKQCFHSLAIPIVSNARYEADDLMGTLAVKGANAGFYVVIVTGDMDLFQMADNNICIAVPHKGYSAPEYLGEREVMEKLGINPGQVPDYKGLTGDASDNLKGVNGIGPKTAVDLIRAYGSIDGIYSHLHEIKSAIRRKLESDRDSAFLCRDMARIVVDVPIDIDLCGVFNKKADVSDVDRFFSDMEFYTLKTRLRRMLLEDEKMASYFHGDVLVSGVSDDGNIEQGSGKITVDQLPLLD